MLGVVAKTGLTPIPEGGALAPGYDYSLIFSRTQVYTKRSHASALFNNPSGQSIEDFGEAGWKLHEVPAEPLVNPREIQAALQAGQSITAQTRFESRDGARVWHVTYPVKWADCALDGSAFRIETGPVLFLDPELHRPDTPPAFEAFQWMHLDYHALQGVRCLVEQPTPLFSDAEYAPGRDRVGIKADDVAEIRRGAHTVTDAQARSLLSTDHYGVAESRLAAHALFSLNLPIS